MVFFHTVSWTIQFVAQYAYGSVSLQYDNMGYCYRLSSKISHTLRKRDQIIKIVSTYSQKIPELKPYKTEPVC